VKYIFIGNRRFVLEEMLRLRLNVVEVFVVSGTHLENDIKNMKCKHILISSKAELIERLESSNYDILVSNGCPYILPIRKMQQKTYINIHPSLLPDLKGVDPVIGSILFNRDAGATCHIMDDSIDGGDIISQVKIPYSNDLDVSLLYQLSFIAEKECFTKALNLNFKAIKIQEDENGLIYYTRKQQDKYIKFNESISEMTNKIKAFNNKSQGAFFIYGNAEYRVFDLDVLSNEFLREYASNFEDLKILFCYEDSIIFNKDGCVVKFHQVSGDLSKIQTNTFINRG